MVSEERKMELVKKINDANKILQRYGLMLSYDQFKINNEAPLEPHMYLKLGERYPLNRPISLEVLKDDEKWDYNQPVDLVFYVGQFEFVARSFNESVEALDKLSEIMRDVKILNNLGLWVEKDLVTLR